VQSYNTTSLLSVQVFSLIEPIFLASIAEVAQNDAWSHGAFIPRRSYRYTLNRRGGTLK